MPEPVAAKELIDLLVEPLSPPPDLESPKTAPGKSTSIWATQNLANMRLAPLVDDNKDSWTWNIGSEYQKFREELNRSALVDPSISIRPFKYPRTEGDIVTVVDAELLNVVYRVGKDWMPPQPKNVEWTVEILSEAYTPPRSVEDVGGVRVDKIFVANANRPRRMVTRKLEQKMSTKPPDTIKSRNSYLPRKHLWNGGSLAPGVELNGMKGLVAIEIKMLGILDDAQRILGKMAGKRESLAGLTQISEGRNLSAVIKQAIRYANHYGVRYVFVTDHRTGILLDIPELKKAPGLTPQDRSRPQLVLWAVVGGDYARQGLLFLLHQAYRELDILVQNAKQKESFKGKEKATQGAGPSMVM